MGCDIHLFREHKVEGKWFSSDAWYQESEESRHTEPGTLHLSVVHEMDQPGRCYAAFGLLAGVRTEYDYSLPEKGIPDDVSWLVEQEFIGWDVDAHTPSFINYIELQELRVKLGLLLSESSEDVSTQKRYLENLVEYLEDANPSIYIPGDSDRRLVFWFDN